MGGYGTWCGVEGSCYPCSCDVRMCRGFLVAVNACLGGKEIQPVHSKGDQSRAFFGRNGVKAETAIFWPPHVKR